MRGRRYTPEFRDGTVRLVLEQGLTAAKAAKDLGMPTHALPRGSARHASGRAPSPPSPTATCRHATASPRRRAAASRSNATS